MCRTRAKGNQKSCAAMGDLLHKIEELSYDEYNKSGHRGTFLFCPDGFLDCDPMVSWTENGGKNLEKVR